MSQISKCGLVYETSNKISVFISNLFRGKPIASESTKPNDLSSFFSGNCLFIVVHYHCVVYKGGNKSAIQTISYQYD